MVAAGLWKREDIDRLEAQLFRDVNSLPNVISNKAIMNVACSMRNAWEIVEPLAQRANLQAKRLQQIQIGRRVTFQGVAPRQEERKDGVEQIDQPTPATPWQFRRHAA